MREGRISRAAEKLRVSQPTISAQLKLLEESLGERLFQRQGRTLVLTDVGRVVDRYASEIFTAGSELLETLKGRPSGRAPRLAVGVANAVPKLVVYRLLSPAINSPEPVQISCHEDDTDQLLAQLATHALDVVISDTPAAPHVRVKVFNHLLGESGTSFFAGRPLAQRLRRRFPASLTGARMLAADDQHLAAACARAVVRDRGSATARRRGVRGPGAAHDIRRADSRGVSGPDGDRGRNTPESSCRRRRAHIRRARALLRDLGGAAIEACRSGGDHERRPHRDLRGAPTIGAQAASQRRLSRFIASHRAFCHNHANLVSPAASAKARSTLSGRPTCAVD